MSAISADGRHVAFVSDGLNSWLGNGQKLVLYERDHARLGLLLRLDIYNPLSGKLRIDGGGRLLLSTSDNRLVDDDASNHFIDVFLLDKLSDYLFDDGFEPAQ